MISLDIVLTQILVILLYVVIGFIAGKSKLISPDQRKYLTRICTDLILPFTIVSASSQTVSGSKLLYLGLMTGLVLLMFALVAFISVRISSARGVSEAAKVTTASLLTFPNCTFLGLPLCRALFGDIAVLYNAVFLVAFNILFFTWQISAFTGKKFSLRNLCTLPTIATAVLVVMLALGWHLPDPVQTVASSTGAMITPLSLIIIGVMMSESKLSDILSERRAFLVVFRLVNLEASDKLCMLVYMACPCATLTSIYAIQTGKEPEYAARSVLMSTLFFALTLPAIIWIGGHFLG